MSHQTGLFELPDHEYFSHPAISKSGLDRIAVSPAHYKAWLEAPDEPTEAMEFGTAFHRLILEPELFDSSVVKAPECDRRTKLGKELWDNFCSENSGKIILKADQYERLRGMAARWRRHPSFEGTHQNSKHEISAFWELDGIHCKARPDIIHVSGTIYDLKTCDSAQEEDFQRTILNRRYHVQAAWYLDGVSQASGERFKDFKFIAVEKKPPYEIAVYQASEEMIGTGRHIYEKNFSLYAECLRADHWPGYPTEKTIDLPRWAIGDL